MSKGEESGGGRTNEGLLANTFEAIIGAIYLDQGFLAVEEFLQQKLFPKFEYIFQQKLYKDSKSLLQEVVQSQGLETPIYKVVSAIGPDHDKIFTVVVLVSGEQKGMGEGRSKQLAQQAAASQALEKFE